MYITSREEVVSRLPQFILGIKLFIRQPTRQTFPTYNNKAPCYYFSPYCIDYKGHFPNNKIYKMRIIHNFTFAALNMKEKQLIHSAYNPN